MKWMDDAACKGQGDAFHPEQHTTRHGETDATFVAKQTCSTCPVQDTCLAHALEHQEWLGIWGGLTPPERRAFAKSRRLPIIPRRRNVAIEHGTDRGYHAHRNHDVYPICAACKEAHNAAGRANVAAADGGRAKPRAHRRREMAQ